MTPTRKRRLAAVSTIAIGVAAAISLAVFALRDNALFFYSPTKVANNEVPTGQNFRLGGMVVDGSVVRDPNSLEVKFDLTDYQETITVQFEGILPDLFREGQGIIAQGKLTEGQVFRANEVLAKHDENYMPPEVAAALAEAESGGSTDDS